MVRPTKADKCQILDHGRMGVDPPRWESSTTVQSHVSSRRAVESKRRSYQLDSVAGVFGKGVFDYVLSSETAGFYKPHPSVYELATRILGIGCKDVLHVAGGAGDVLGAAAYGMTCYWSNRANDIPLDPALGPDYQGKDLSGVLKLI